MRVKILILSAASLLFSCQKNKPEETTISQKPLAPVKVPSFMADSSFSFIEKQVAFGPRIPGTEAHERAGDYLVATLKRFGAQVTEQKFESETFDGHYVQLRNIIGSYFPEKKKRILLAAHWDTRPFADKDRDEPNARFEGANDGASGVGVLLEIARLLNESRTTDAGIDIIFFDGEDWGEKAGTQDRQPLPEGLQEWWCLGSQYWAKHKHRSNYSAYYGILLDMVGAAHAQFHREGYSQQFAPSVVEKIWSTAARLGYSHIFVRQNQDEITDDHVFVNTIAKIPMVDIVHYEPGIGYFGDFHHTRKDNLKLIDTKTLKAVGETVATVIYAE